ncbi:hypothetical protein ColLi_13248 [Colletotrichum liriopes]|uniref:Uncharacterized protein n=1 Tax=Colletotrichum liriopes TaxID=708192 RepID=A0AA37GZV5_9PEZI|nr:hypothetical protein ColLi_13248 [Colletotrichum liriopes]
MADVNLAQGTVNNSRAALASGIAVNERLAAIQAELSSLKVRYHRIPDSYKVLLVARKDTSREYRRLQAAEKASVEAEDRVKADKDGLRDAQHAFNLANASMRAAEGREHRFDELDLGRRVAKKQRNKTHKTRAELVEDHHGAYGAWAAAAEAFHKAEVAEQLKAKEWEERGQAICFVMGSKRTT